MFVISTGILFWFTIDRQFRYSASFSIVFILGNIDAESSPTTVIPYSCFVTVHKPVVLHRIGYMTILYDAHGRTRNAIVHWNSGKLIGHRLNVPCILCGHLRLFRYGNLSIETLSRITCTKFPHLKSLTAKFLLLHFRSISCNEILLLFGFRCFPICRLRAIGECFLQ